MTTSSTSSSTSGTGLSSTWTALLTTQMNLEKQQRLTRLTQQSSALDVKKAVFTDLSNQISDLKTSLGSLWSTSGSYVLGGAHSTSVTNQATSGTTVLTASADSTAATGSYNIVFGKDDHLATQNRVASTNSYSSQFTVDNSDTLYSIAAKISSATYDSGKGVSATVVNNTLTIQSTSSGQGYNMKLADTGSGGPLESLGILNSDNSTYKTGALLQAGVDAQFSVNGVSVQRSSNSGLTDVIQGVTLNLASDAVNNSATLTIQNNTDTVKSALQTFISKFNALQTYLGNKTGYTKVDDTHYTAGALANEFSVRSLKADLTDQVSFSSGTGAVKFFADMGLTLSNNQLSISDSSKLDNALKNNLTDVQSFLDTKMSNMDKSLGTYVGSNTSFVTYSIQSMTQQKTDLTTSITNENKRLDARKAALTAYYLTLDLKITADTNTTAALSSYIYSSIYGSTSKSA
jgi:flagellar hook-associated protein 2